MTTLRQQLMVFILLILLFLEENWMFLGVTNYVFNIKIQNMGYILIYLNHNQITFLTGLSVGMEQKRVKSACPSRKRSP